MNKILNNFKFKENNLDGVWHAYIIIALILSVLAVLYLFNLIKMPKLFSGIEKTLTTINTLNFMPQNRSIKHKSKSLFFDDNNNSLDYFFKKLNALEKNKNDNLVKILYYGTSNIGFDRVPSQMRKRLQEIFGDGGKGFIPISKGWKYHRHKDIEWKFSNSWKTNAVTYNKRADGCYGLGGVLSYNQGKAWVRYKTIIKQKNINEYIPGTKFSKLTLYFRTSKDSDPLNLKIDNKFYKVLTKGKEASDEIYSLKLDDKAHSIELASNSKKVNLYGFTFDRQSGIVIDGLMLVGAHVKALLNFNKEHIKKQISLREPDLLIFHMGSNEAFLEHNEKSIKKFITSYTDGIKQIRASKPEASCLIISIKDIGMKYRNIVKTRPGVPIIVKASKEVAKNTNCAFFNLFQYMGGKGTMNKWHKTSPKLVSSDYGHLFNPGAKRIGNIISDAIISKYKDFKEKNLNE